MTDTANESMTAEEFRRRHKPQQSLDGLEPPHKRYEEALAIDPGTDTGIAWTGGDCVQTATTSFWPLTTRHLAHLFDDAGMPTLSSAEAVENCCILLEAPYESRPGMAADESAIAYRSGQVAREAELIRDRFEHFGHEVIEHDPSQQGQKWDSGFARKIVGNWKGPDNEHCRDAIRLLFFYNFL